MARRSTVYCVFPSRSGSVITPTPDAAPRLDDAMKAQFRGAAQQRLDAARVLDARKLHEYPVVVDALDRRLRDADLIDALADDLEALLRRCVDAVLQAGRREGDADLVVRGRYGLDRDVGRRRPEARCVGLQRAQKADGLASARAGRKGDRHAVGAGGDPGIGQAMRAQRRARVLRQGQEPLPDQRLRIDLEDEMRSAPKVEAEGHVICRPPLGQGGALRLVQQIGQGGEYTGEQDHGVCQSISSAAFASASSR